MGEAPPAKIPFAGNIVSVILQMVTFGALSVCLVRRMPTLRGWKRLSLAAWLILAIYIDSFLFVFATAILTRGTGINESQGVCDGGILLCLVCYMTTKILIYYFLVEKAYIVRGSRLPRMKTKMWLFNCLGMLLPYIVVVILNFIFRIAYIDDDGVCIIGMEKISMLPLISFDVVVNVYLTLLFIVPLRRLYSYQNNTNTSLHTVAFRSFIGSCATLTSSVVNLTVLMVLQGEPGWICLMCCNADILFSVLVLHWVTQVDRTPGNSSLANSHIRSNPNITALNPIPDGKVSDIQMPRSVRHSLQTRGAGNAASMGSTMMTEIMANAQQERGRGRDRGCEEDIVELRGIRVQTETTQEVEADARSEGSAAGYVVERGVSAEKMV
ncbi:hypothetical protein K458DRAFT_364394 [Lentithecium fluviatile CBS 122367]|uniref:G-protein coupled receptors family 1 profile domain-containing protein n=1 Tax=Lentithecium fluviatile CBS 122367 TaxID=1168545 RepID=A0A6G1J4V6_9PLEO|nr:hypothetical protein K458DRAFT_364394 [Lentithecium fluviatile CBS 122367]